LANYLRLVPTEKKDLQPQRFTTFDIMLRLSHHTVARLNDFTHLSFVFTRLTSRYIDDNFELLNRYCTFAASYFHYVSPHSPGSILFAASHGQRPHIAYQTITLSTQSTFFCGYLTVPPSTGLDTTGHYAPSTSHPTTRVEAYAADGGQKPVLQHFGT
jgi:hypothetical protein